MGSRRAEGEQQERRVSLCTQSEKSGVDFPSEVPRRSGLVPLIILVIVVEKVLLIVFELFELLLLQLFEAARFLVIRLV